MRGEKHEAELFQTPLPPRSRLSVGHREGWGGQITYHFTAKFFTDSL